MIEERDSRQTPDDDLQPRPWMRSVLKAAAVYNLVWGAAAVLSPLTMFRMFGADPLPAYPELWQCIGMMVGVFGIGYAFAARHPYVHWPVILTGLLGKILGPIGFVIAVSAGRLPAEFGWTILTNDVIWWIPFGVILWKAACYHQARTERVSVPPPALRLDPLTRMMSQRGATLAELSRRKPVLLVFLRHSGCTFCREAVSDIAEQRPQIENKDVDIAFVHMGQAEPVELLEKHSLTDLHSFRDPLCTLYDAFGLKMGTIGQLLGPNVLWRGLLLQFRGHRAGSFNGNVFRMPGVFLLHNCEVVRSYRHKSAADRPDYVRLASLPEKAPA